MASELASVEMSFMKNMKEDDIFWDLSLITNQSKLHGYDLHDVHVLKVENCYLHPILFFYSPK